MPSFVKKLKDPISGFTHFIGLLFAIFGLVLLINRAVDLASVRHIVTYSIFGSGLILLYLVSTLYHWIPAPGKAQRCLRKLDHIMIFVLIAASYTPICLIPLRGGWGWSLFGVVWGIAVLGIILKIVYIEAPDWLSALIYLVMGWLALIAIYPLLVTLQPAALAWLVTGGIFYSVGAVIYVFEKPDFWFKVFSAHDLFHIFVLLGSASHFWLVYKYISMIS